MIGIPNAWVSALSLAPQTIYQFLRDDFEGAWDSLARNPTAGGRGNFTFALQTMILLEFLCRLCASDMSGKAIRDFSDELYKIEPRYFTTLPGRTAKPRDFDLPYKKSNSRDEPLWALFDVIRNGEAHQYLQKVVCLSNGLSWIITLTGAEPELFLSNSRSVCKTHLAFRKDSQGNVALILCPNVLFLDFQDAVSRSGIMQRNLSIKGSFQPQYNFSSHALEKALAANGHQLIP